MASTFQVNIIPDKLEFGEIIIALLSDLDYHGFEENGSTIVAFISEDLFNEEILKTTLIPYSKNYTIKVIPYENWNAIWEAKFEPVLVNDFVSVRAKFHPPSSRTKYDIIITPKMSFGTAHHPTTFLMIQQMQQLECTNKKVLDFGTGTGILAILAAKMGALDIVAIDNDEHSIENAKENIQVNDIENILVKQQDSIANAGTYEIILANINLNIIMLNIEMMYGRLIAGGVMILSGFLSHDADIIIEKCNSLHFTLDQKLKKDGWICLSFTRHM